MNKIETIIGDIEEFLENCKFYPLSNNKLVVPKEELEDLLAELRIATPEEIKKYQKIISNEQAITTDAKRKADAMVNEATQRANGLVEQNSITNQAYNKADEIIARAQEEAEAIRMEAYNEAEELRNGAMQYTEGMLQNTQILIESTMEEARIRFENFYGSLDSTRSTIDANINEFRGRNRDSGQY